MQAADREGADAVGHVLPREHIRGDRLPQAGDRRRAELAQLHPVPFHQTARGNAEIELLPERAVSENDKGTGPVVCGHNRFSAKIGSVRVTEPGQQGNSIRAQLLRVPVVPAQRQRAAAALPASGVN